jgi:hypothetical protein
MLAEPYVRDNILSSRKEIIMEKRIKKIEGAHPALIIAVALSLILSAISIVRVSSFYRTRAEESVVAEDISYNVYIGLTDKNQKRQLIDENAALETVKTICINHNASYTIYNASGGYKQEGVVHTEKTLVLEMDRVSEETLYEIVNDIKKRLNVGSVMVLKQTAEVFDY